MAYYDQGSPLNNSATGAAAAAVTVSLTPAASNLAYLQGVTITCTAPAAIQVGVVTITGVTTPNNVPLSFQFTETVAAGGVLHLLFPGNGLEAATRGGAITISFPAVTSGGAVSISAYGYQL